MHESMTQSEITQIALQQSAADLNCEPADFLRQENVTLPYEPSPRARKYYTQPITANFVTYGHNVVAAAEPAFIPLVRAYTERFTYYHCFETPNLNWLSERLRARGQAVCFMAEYWLPTLSRLQKLSCPLPTEVLTQADFAGLYLPEWSNALCEKRKESDVLGVGAFDGGRLVGLAACSADCDTMWQIGLDVLPAYRRRGIASALTSQLAIEILNRGKVPFYCCAWSNVASARNAVRSGFSPAWAEMTVKPAAVMRKMNN